MPRGPKGEKRPAALHGLVQFRESQHDHESLLAMASGFETRLWDMIDPSSLRPMRTR